MTNPVPSELAAVFRGALTRCPGLWITDVMAAHSPPLTYKDYKLGLGGTCMDFVGSDKTLACVFGRKLQLHLTPPRHYTPGLYIRLSEHSNL
jgi:hypothetical protein